MQYYILYTFCKVQTKKKNFKCQKLYKYLFAFLVVVSTNVAGTWYYVRYSSKEINYDQVIFILHNKFEF